MPKGSGSFLKEAKPACGAGKWKLKGHRSYLHCALVATGKRKSYGRHHRRRHHRY